MTRRARWVLLLGSALGTGCAAPVLAQRTEVVLETAAPRAVAAPRLAGRLEAAQPALHALQAGSFAGADELAEQALAADAANPHARLVRAVTRYQKAMRRAYLDLESALAHGAVDHESLRSAMGDAEAALAAVDADLEVAATAPDLAVELCPACWEVDWNQNGRIDDGDRHLFEVERDADDVPIPEGDPRRKPTFRFDVGDVSWARAFVSFQRALLDAVLAYDWSALDVLAAPVDKRPETVVIHLVHPERIAAARQRVLEGLDRSDAARRAYLAETDDDREWVPSPHQQSHPLPLRVDQALYDTWEGVLGDVRRLVQGSDGLSTAEIVRLVGDRRVKSLPRGYLDIGRLFAHPADFTLKVGPAQRASHEGDWPGVMAALFGDHYVAEMTPSPLTGRLLRMKGEIAREEESFGRKLLYFFWLN